MTAPAIMTASPTAGTVIEALRSGAADFVAKPIVASVLLEKVRRLTGARWGAATARTPAG